MPAVGYVAEGTVRWTTSSGSIDIKAGEGAGTPQLPITETNPGTTANLWYAFAVSETGLESGTLGLMNRLAAGGRLPLPQPDGSYTLRLDLISLDGGGRTASQSHGGAELIFVLDGQIEVRTANDSHEYRGSKQGTGVAPGAAVQVLNRTSTPARVLEFFYTPDALTFETTLTTSP
jgi:quercetin dioxygenase-like cupin family protein